MRKTKLVKSRYFILTKKHFYFLSFFIVLFLVVYTVFHSSLFKIKKIDCRLDYQPCADPYLLKELNKYYQTNIFTLNTTKLANKLSSAYSTIDKITITKKLPYFLYVRIESTQPVIALKIKGQSIWLLYDSHLKGVAVIHNQPNLPYLIVQNAKFAYGQPPEDIALRKILTFSHSLTQKLPRIKRLFFQDDTLYAWLDNSILAVFTLTKPSQDQLSLLSKILKNPKLLETNQTKTIDVRFSQAVLKSSYPLLF